LFERLRAKVLAPLPGTYENLYGGRERIHTKRAIAAKYDRAYVAFFVLIGHNQLAAGSLELIGTIGQLHPIDMTRIEQSLYMRIEPEDGRTPPSVIAADAFEDRRTIIDHVRHHMDFRIFPGYQLAIVPHVCAVFCISPHKFSPSR
jgi:hypothetical protein